MIINVHAGHNADGQKACGAIGIIKESTEARKVKNFVIEKLRAKGHTVYDCTVDKALNQAMNLYGIVKLCNAHKADLDVSIHFNSGAKDTKGNGNTTGCEVLLYNGNNGITNTAAVNVCRQISSLGFKNRGVKYRPDLYVLKKTNAPAMLIECCFVDDMDDCKIYNAETMANAIVAGITGGTVAKNATTATTTTSTTTTASKLGTVVAATPYVVKVLVSDLNIRKGAGANYDIVGQCRKGTKYTIVDVSNYSWGKLKSGAGWIYLSSQYVEKC